MHIIKSDIKFDKWFIYNQINFTIYKGFINDKINSKFKLKIYKQLNHVQILIKTYDLS